jgi:Zinc finger, C2H2 type
MSETIYFLQNIDGIPYCKYFDFPAIKILKLQVHIKAVHEGLCPYKCTLCSKEFPFPKSLGKHIEECHVSGIACKRKLYSNEIFAQGTADADKPSEEPKKIGPYACDLCDKRFNHLSSVFYHKEAEHNDGIRFACNKCDKSFKHRQLLQRHQLVHTDDR